MMTATDKFAYFVSASVVRHVYRLYQIECSLSTGDPPNFIAKDFLAEHWDAHRQAAGALYPFSASKD